MGVVDRGPEVRLRSATADPYDDAIAAARTCYSPRVIEALEITERQRRSIGPLTYDGGHHTVYQHASFEFSLAGISIDEFAVPTSSPSGASSPIPEPSSVLMMMIGGAFVLFSIRKVAL